MTKPLFLHFKGHVIRDGGALVLGQDQDAWEGHFNEFESFTGQMTRVNVWNKVLNQREIHKMSTSCRAGKGNVFQWYDFRAHVIGSVKMIREPQC